MLPNWRYILLLTTPILLASSPSIDEVNKRGAVLDTVHVTSTPAIPGAEPPAEDENCTLTATLPCTLE